AIIRARRWRENKPATTSKIPCCYPGDRSNACASFLQDHVLSSRSRLPLRYGKRKARSGGLQRTWLKNQQGDGERLGTTLSLHARAIGGGYRDLRSIRPWD